MTLEFLILLVLGVAAIGSVLRWFLFGRHAKKPASQRRPTAPSSAPSEPYVSAFAPQIRKSEALTCDYFISHASDNALDAKKLVEALEAQGMTCWIAPRNIRPGQAYGDAIADAVAHSTRATLVLISEASERSASVKAELELARRFNRPIMPVILKGHEPGKGMVYYIGTSHWLPFDDASPSTIAALIDALRD